MGLSDDVTAVKQYINGVLTDNGSRSIRGSQLHKAISDTLDLFSQIGGGAADDLDYVVPGTESTITDNIDVPATANKRYRVLIEGQYLPASKYTKKITGGITLNGSMRFFGGQTVTFIYY